MKRKLVVAVTVTLAGVLNPFVSVVDAQSQSSGPLVEVINGGAANASNVKDAFANREFLSGDSEAFPQSPLGSNVVYTPAGQAVEVFDPSAGNAGFGRRAGVGSSPVGGVGNGGVESESNDWITSDGRINLERSSPAGQLWAPAEPGDGGWTDGPLGLQLGVDWLFFTRGVNGGSIFAFNSAGETFSNAELDLSLESTARYRLGFSSDQGTGYEFVAYDFQEFTGSLSLTGEGITPVFFGAIPAEPVDSYTTTYQSRIKNFELNVWSRRSQAVRIGYGLRYFAIEEKYDVIEGDVSTATMGTGNTAFAGFFSRTENDLFGPQIMLELYRTMTPSTALVGGVKGMLLNNSADIDVNTGNIDANGDDSFLTGGVNFHGGITYRPFGGLSFQAGYEGVFVGSVASAITQSESNSVFADAISPVGEGLYYGGGYVGCTVTF